MNMAAIDPFSAVFDPRRVMTDPVYPNGVAFDQIVHVA